MNDDFEDTSDPRLWKKAGWIARVVRSEDGDGWAATMMRPGDTEPALVTPWVMGRDKVNPKPLDHSGFATLVKGATEVMRRAAQAEHARLNRSIVCLDAGGYRVLAELAIQKDEDDPHAILTVTDELSGEVRRTGRVVASFKLAESAVQRFVRTGE